MPSNFIHLHTHSHYSLLDGLAKTDALIDLALKYKMSAIALTEHGNMYGTIEFYKKAKKAGIKPIIGVEAYVATESLHQKRPGVDNKRHHLVLLAKNEAGYKNIVKMVTVANLEGYYYKPRIDKELLRKHSEGVIALTACMGGEIPKLVRNGHYEEAKEAALEYQEILGKGNFYIEIQDHPHLEGHQALQKELIKLARETDIPLVATQDVHYLKSEDAIAQDALVAIGRKETLKDPGRQSNVQEDFSFKSPEEMTKLFKDTPDAIENTIKIAGQCNVELELGNWVFPKTEVPEGKTPEEHLRDMTTEGFKEKFEGKLSEEENKIYKDRIEYELNIIITKGYAPYFITVSRILTYAQDNGIFTNTRGSAAGSLVSYLVDITNVNPIEYKLPFERFLNPDRPSAPDIDMDFADNKRDLVIQHVKEVYGEDHVAQIGTFGTMAARGSVRDVARVLGKPYELGDRVSKLIPMGAQGFPMTIERALKEEPDLKKLYNSDKEVKEIIDMAQQIEGSARHISVHAAGVVISPKVLTEYVPLQRESNGDKIITQYDMHEVEDMGLLKFDFLGIKNLTMLETSVKLVKKLRGIDIDINNIPFDDPTTFALLARGETMGLFQLNGSGMTKFLIQLEPKSMWDVMAMIALYRPGPLAMIPDYIERKKNPTKVKYLVPQLKEILEPTYGVLVYQDDVLIIATQMAGYTWGDADKFRKAIGKKIPEEMAKQKDKFINGCIEIAKMPPEKAKELWNTIETFAAYGFNKAHTASYGRVAYQTAYMKANYTAEYMAALMTADSGDTEKIAAAVHECKRMGINVLPPDINESFEDFTIIKGSESKDITEDAKAFQSKDVKKDQIRFGLYTIKNFGEEIGRAIIEERKRGGKFKSFSDFLDRVKHKNLTKKSLEALIMSGAMDNIGERAQLLFNMEDALAYNKQVAKTGQNQVSLFSLMEDQSSAPALRLKETKPASQEEKLLWEKELLGLYISGHPLDKFKHKMEKVMKIGQVKQSPQGVNVVTMGMIETAKQIITKKGDKMAFIQIADYTESIEGVIFPRVMEEKADIIEEGICVAIQGKISHRNDTPSIIIDKIKRLSIEE